MANAPRFSFDSWFNDYESLPLDDTEFDNYEFGEEDVVDMTITCNGQTYIYVYPREEEEQMKDCIWDQVETGRLHPYVGLMALMAMGEEL